MYGAVKKEEKYEPDEYGFRRRMDEFEPDIRCLRDEGSLIMSGQWVLIIKRVPVGRHQPQTYGIYYALPFIRQGLAREKDGAVEKTLVGVDEYGRQCAKIYTPDEVVVFTDEYRVLDEEKVRSYMDAGWELHEFRTEGISEPVNMGILEQGRSLTEDERECIYSLMLDGLSEQQACEEYFLSRHTDYENTKICYLPGPEQMEELLAVFGE